MLRAISLNPMKSANNLFGGPNAEACPYFRIFISPSVECLSGGAPIPKPQTLMI
jgi:hypothetical protein